MPIIVDQSCEQANRYSDFVKKLNHITGQPHQLRDARKLKARASRPHVSTVRKRAIGDEEKARQLGPA